MSQIADRLIPSYVADVPRARAALDGALEAARQEGRDEIQTHEGRWRTAFLIAIVIALIELTIVVCSVSSSPM